MKRYEILEHISDLKIKVFGENLKELFKNAIIGMFEGGKYEQDLKSKDIKRKISIKSLDLPSLLVDFLSEVLYLSEVNQEVYNNIQFKKFDNKSIEGILLGKKLKRIGVVIKGVTYHNLNIHQKKDGCWQATILFDI